MTPGKKLLAILICTALLGSTQALAAVSSKGTTHRPSKPRFSKTQKKRSKFRRIRWNPVLRGSYESMLRQNEEIDRLQLLRIEDDAQLEDLILKQELVEIPESRSLRIASNLDSGRRYCRPWTVAFLQDLSADFYQQFKTPIQVNSAVRTVEQQKKLRRTNRNAAPELGETASSHLAGITVDISKAGLSRKQRKWLDAYLLELRNRNLIEAAEERRQPVYHIMVSERYDGYREAQSQAENEPNSPTAVINQD
ncbi:MAG TPA: DUF5715 family protein [Terriglobales bacterium]|nr:DUF5715 family protein [Terriglobales bacterium]